MLGDDVAVVDVDVEEGFLEWRIAEVEKEELYTEGLRCRDVRRGCG